MNDAAFNVYAGCAGLLVLNLAFLSFYTGLVRSRLKAYINPEDWAVTKSPEREAEHEDVQRIHRAHRNALENILPTLAVGWLFVMSGATPGAVRAYMITFAAARVLHTAVYLAELQPWRTLTFFAGWFCTVGMAVQLVLKAVA